MPQFLDGFTMKKNLLNLTYLQGRKTIIDDSKLIKNVKNLNDLKKIFKFLLEKKIKILNMNLK